MHFNEVLRPNISEWIAYTSDRVGTFEIWLFRPFDGLNFPLTQGLGEGFSIPYWSPDQRKIAFIDDLIVAYLDYRHDISMSNVEEARRLYPDSPVQQLYHLLEGLAARMEKLDYRGCPFMNTVVEFPDIDHPGLKKAVECRQELWSRIEDITRLAGAKNPGELTLQLRMLCNGAIMFAYMHKSAYHPDYFLNAARLLIEKQLA